MLGAAPVVAQVADFNGTWDLDLAKSFLAKEHPSADYTLTAVIAQQKGAIGMTMLATHRTRMNIPLPDSKLTQELVPDGTARPAQRPGFFPGMPPESVQVTASWQGDTLVIEELGSGVRGASSTERRFYLSDSGNLVELVKEHNTFGDSEQRLVFERHS